MNLVRVLCVATLAVTGSFGVSGFASAVELCEASWYGPGFHGNMMANNKERFNQNATNTVAHKTLPFDTWVKITNLENGRALEARVTDRGPFHDGRCVDLPEGGADVLGFKNAGTAPVRVEVL